MFEATFDNLFNKDSHNTTNSYNTTINTYNIEDQWRILRWLSPLQPWDRHHDVAAARAEGVGEWVLKAREFEAWHRRGARDESVDATLFCCGAPGAGKTYICSLVIDTLCDTIEASLVVSEPSREEPPTSPHVGVACLYNYYGSRKEQTTTSMLGAILKQFVMELPEIPDVVSNAFRAAKGRSPPPPKLVELLHQVLGEFRQTFICVDALDELELAQRLEFLRSLKQILKKSPTTQLFLTGRPHIGSELDRHLTGSAGFIIAQSRKDDIKKFVAMKLDTDPESDIMTRELKSEIMSYIPEHCSQIFLLAVLHIDAVLGEMTVFARRRMLYETKNSLSNAYSGTLERLKQQSGDKPRMAVDVLMWVSLAERPLHVNELCHALGVELGTVCLDTENVPLIEVLLRCCLGLVTVDRETSTVRLIHATLQEYLRGHPDIFNHPHKIIAEVCLTYLNFESVRRLPPNIIDASEEFPLLQYASHYWGIHLRKGQEDLTESTKALAVEVLKGYDTNNHVALSLLLRQENWRKWASMPTTANYTGLHHAAALGITKIAAALLQTGNRDVNLRDPHLRTPLAWAAMNGHDGIVKLLLDEEEISPDIDDGLGHTPLSWAARNGHEKIVKMLLSRPDVKPDGINYAGRTALSYAAEGGHEGIVKLLLSQKDVDPNSTDSMGRTPLSWAAWGGHKRVTEILLQKPNVDPDPVDKDGRTPLFWAVKEDHEGIVGLLLKRTEVQPDRVDKDGDTAITSAIRHRQEKVARIFLDRADINLEFIDGHGQTLLSLAAENGSEDLVKLLLERSKIDPNLAAPTAERHSYGPL